MVAKFSKVPRSAGRYARYLANEAEDVDPDFELRAYGRGAKYLGIHGKALTLKEFENLAAGLSPDGTERIGRAHRFRQWGFEKLFSAPSGISMAIEVLDDRLARLLIKAVEKAAHAAMNAVERRAAYTRVTTGGVKRREPIGLIYVVATHARNRKGEPNLHAHVLVLSRGIRANGQWAAIENAHVLNAQKATHRVFNQALAYYVERDVGLKVRRTKKTIRIEGVDKAWARTARREQIVLEQVRTGRTDHRGATKAALDTREPKSKTTFTEQRKRWREKAHRAGRYAADLGVRAWKMCVERVEDYRADRCYKLAAKYVRANVTKFTALKIDEVAALFATTRNISPERLVTAGEKFRSRPAKYGVAQAGESLGEPVYTSSRMKSREDKLHAQLANLSGIKRCGLSDYQIARALAGSPATDGQLMRRVQRLTAARGVVSGESVQRDDAALTLAVFGYRHNKVPVLAVAPSRQAAGRMHGHLDVTAYTALEFCEKLKPPTHWHCIATGLLRGRGNPHQRMGHAERIRRTSPKLPEGCVVIAELGREHIQELRAITKAVKAAKGKLIVTGRESVLLREQVEQRTRRPDLTAEFKGGARTQHADNQSQTRTRARRFG